MVRYVSETPDGLKLSLENWFTTQASLGVPREVLADTLNSSEAA